MHARSQTPPLAANHTRNYFTLHGQVRMAELGDLYALDFRDFGESTLSEAIRRLRCRPAAGDCIALGPVELLVLETGRDGVRRAGLRFSDAGSQPGGHPRRNGNTQRRWMNAGAASAPARAGERRRNKGGHERLSA